MLQKKVQECSEQHYLQQQKIKISQTDINRKKYKNLWHFSPAEYYKGVKIKEEKEGRKVGK